MAYIKGYTYDIFISYAHMDNEKLSGQAYNWVEQFYKDLNLLLLRRIGNMDSIKIWWDNKKLDGSKLFDQSIQEGIEQSAILICLTTPGYLGSAYCRKELELFYKKAQREPVGLKVGDSSRILNVLLNNIPYAEWPHELNGTSGFKFHDASEKDDWGDPVDVGAPGFKTQLQNLRDAIIKLISNFPKEEVTAPLKQIPVEEHHKGNSDNFTIYIGEVADSLRTTRKRVISDLEKKGYTVHHGVPPPDEAQAHDTRVKEEMENAQLSVHLLDQYPGREIIGIEDSWYPQKQTELGLSFAKSKLIWVPAELDTEAVEEENYKIFLKGLETKDRASGNFEYIRGAKTMLAQEITDFAEQLKAQQNQQPSTGKISVLLDTHFEDQRYAWELSMGLLENQIQPFINPQEDEPRDTSNMLGDRISQVSKLVFLYGKVNWTWVQKRVNAALKLIIDNDYAVDEFFIFMVPPHKNPRDVFFNQKFFKVNVIDNSDNPQLKTDALQQFYKTIKVVA